MIAFLALGLVAGATYVAAARPTFRATIQLVVTPRAETPDASEAYQANLLAQRLAASYSTLMQGHDFAAKVVRQLGLAASAEQLRASVSVAPVPESNLISASVTAHDAPTAQRIANALGPLFASHLQSLDLGQSTSRSGARVTVAESAAMPTSAVSPRPARDIVLGGALGLLIGMGLAFSRMRRRTVLQKIAELEDGNGRQVLAVLSSEQWRRQEEIRELRTSLLAGEPDKRLSLVLVGTTAGLGTSSLVNALGQSYVDLGDSVLVIEAEQAGSTRSSQTDYPGLVDVVLGASDLVTAVETGDGRRPDLLRYGGDAQAAGDLLACSRMGQLLEEVSAAYDVVLVHSPPIDRSASAMSLGSRGCRLVVAASEKELGRERLDAALRRLEQARVPVVGVVVMPRADRSSRSGRPRRQHEASASLRVRAAEPR